MKKKIWLLGILIITVFLAGCSLVFQSVSYEKTKELAIEKGLITEGISQESLLAIEEHKGETLAFFIKEDALGTASISKDQKGYRWYRTTPLMSYDPSLDYFRGAFQLTTEKGETIKILAGVVNSSHIEKLLLKYRNSNKETIIWNRDKSPSKFFYYLLDDTSSIPEIIPVKIKNR